MRLRFELIQERRREIGVTRRQLAETCRTTERTIYTVEKGRDGKQGPGLFLAARLARALGLTLNDLVDWEDEG